MKSYHAIRNVGWLLTEMSLLAVSKKQKIFNYLMKNINDSLQERPPNNAEWLRWQYNIDNTLVAIPVTRHYIINQSSSP